jgi:hypothetical protein
MKKREIQDHTMHHSPGVPRYKDKTSKRVNVEANEAKPMVDSRRKEHSFQGKTVYVDPET